MWTSISDFAIMHTVDLWVLCGIIPYYFYKSYYNRANNEECNFEIGKAYTQDEFIRISELEDEDTQKYLREQREKEELNDTSDPILSKDKDGNEITLMDVIPSPDEGVFTRVENAVTIGQIEEIMKYHLKPRERKVMEMRYGLNGQNAHTQLEVAEKLDISRSYVSRIEKKAIRKISDFILWLLAFSRKKW